MWGRRRFHTVETPRLVLKPVSFGDLPALVRAIGNYDVVRWLGRVPYPYRAADAEAFVAANTAKAGKVWFVTDTSGLVGGVSIDGELGYWFRREVWGQGYAVEAASAAIEAHFDDRRAGHLSSAHLPGNDRSRRVLAKLGFRPVGTRIVAARALAQQVEGVAYELTRTDWSERCRALSMHSLCATRSDQGALR